MPETNEPELYAAGVEANAQAENEAERFRSLKQVDRNKLDLRLVVLEKETLLNMKEIMIAFKRLVALELRIEAIENKLSILFPRG